MIIKLMIVIYKFLFKLFIYIRFDDIILTTFPILHNYYIVLGGKYEEKKLYLLLLF